MHSSDKMIDMLSRGLNAASLRQEVRSHNLANLNTPGYRRKYVAFEDELRQIQGREGSVLSVTHPRHRQAGSAGGEPHIKEESDTVRRVDGNNVDLDREMLALVDNQLRYNSMVQILNNRISDWRYVINEGRR